MADPTYIGNTSFRTFSVVENENSESSDTLTVVRRGDLVELYTVNEAWIRGSSGTTLGYPNMFLQTKSVRSGGGQPFAEITLNFEGFLVATFSNPINIEDSLTIQSGSFVSDQLDLEGNEVTVQASFYAQQTSISWIHRGKNAPTAPQYPAIVPAEINTSTLFNKQPPTFDGSLQVKNVGLLAGFTRSELATGIWAVTETWIVRMEPDEG